MTKTQDYCEFTIPHYLPRQFKRFFRLEPDTFENLLQIISGDAIFRKIGSGGRKALSIEKMLLIALTYFSSQRTVNDIGDQFNVTDFTVLKSRQLITKALLSRLQTFIKWPGLEHRRQLELEFRAKRGFPDVIGIIDGTHIRIKAPRKKPEVYINRKKYHSMNVQAVVQEDRQIIDLFAGYPGSVHDSRVLRNSPLYSSFRADDFVGPNEESYHILGDGGYPLRTWLITPYRNNGHLQLEQTRFNEILSGTRQIVERSFALLKGRFRRLLYLDCVSMETVVDTIVVCCILHNICILNQDELPVFELIDDEFPNDMLNEDVNFINEDNEQNGVAKREEICEFLN